jgi:hypothetical protein
MTKKKQIEANKANALKSSGPKSEEGNHREDEMTTKMTTDKQIAANQANAQKSTGPKTGEGKVNSSMNAVKHGLLAKCALMPGDDVAQFDELRAALHLEFQPYFCYHATLVDDLAALYWRLARSLRIEGEILDYSRCEVRRRIAKSEYIESELELMGMSENSNFGGAERSLVCKVLQDKAEKAKAEVERAEKRLGGAYLHDANKGDTLSKLGRHETRLRNAIQKLTERLEEREKRRMENFRPYDASELKYINELTGDEPGTVV